MLDYLNQNAGALTVIFTAVVTLSTVVYAGLTWALVNETRRMRRAQTEPRVDVIMESTEFNLSFVHLYIRNIGLGPAYDIKIRIEGENETEGEMLLINEFIKSNFFNTGISYLGPGKEVSSNFAQLCEGYDKKRKSVLDINIEYKGTDKKTYKERYLIDFSEIEGKTRLGKPNLYSIAQSLEKIKDDIHKITTGFNKPSVNVITHQDRERQRKEMKQRIEDQKKDNEPTKGN